MPRKQHSAASERNGPASTTTWSAGFELWRQPTQASLRAVEVPHQPW